MQRHALIRFDRSRALWTGASAGAIATMVLIAPALMSQVWPLIWSSHPVFSVTDQIKLVAAVPLLLWVIQRLSPHPRFQATRTAFI